MYFVPGGKKWNIDMMSFFSQLIYKVNMVWVKNTYFLEGLGKAVNIKERPISDKNAVAISNVLQFSRVAVSLGVGGKVFGF